MQLACPQCKKALRAPDAAAGKKLRCPSCSHAIVVPANGAQTPEPVVLKPDEGGAGVRPGKAPRQAPASPPVLVPSATGAEEEDVEDESQSRSRRDSGATRRRGKRRSNALAWWLIGGSLAACFLVAMGLIFILVSLFRGGRPDGARGIIPEEQWQAFEVADRVKARFPGKPDRAVQAAAGMTMVMHSFSPNRDSFYSVGYSEQPLPPARRSLPLAQLLNDACDGAVANAVKMGGGHEVRRDDIQLGPHRGKELVLYVARANGHSVSRMFVVGGRFYMSICGGSGWAADHPNGQRFLNSLEILEADAPAPEPPPVRPALAPLKAPVRTARVATPAPVAAPAPVARLELPPLPEPLPIAAPPITEENAVRLPEPVRAARVGGGGRFLVLHFAGVRKLGVFDVNEAKIVRYIAAAEDDVSFAAGMTKLLVYLPGARLLQRFDLLTGERERVGPAEFRDGKLEAFCMGHASAGPLLVSVAGQGAQLFDAETFQAMSLPAASGSFGLAQAASRLEGGRYWAGATGRVFGHTGNYGMPNGVKTLVLTDGRVRQYGQHVGTWFVVPGPDDRHVFAGGHGVVSTEVQTVANVPFSMGTNSGNLAHLYLPAHHGPYYLHADMVRDRRRAGSQVGSIRIFMLGNKEPIVTIHRTTSEDGEDKATTFGIEHTIHLIPQAKLLVIAAANRDELRLYPADLDAALERSGRDYLLFTSSPPTRYRKGASFTYQAEVKAKRTPVTYKLESGPAGMTVDETGKLTWAVPADFIGKRVDVILVARDAGGQEAFHTLSLTENTTP